MYDNGEKQYRIKMVSDDALPEGQDFAFLECDDEVWLALRRTHLTSETLEECWGAFRDMADC